MEPTRLAAPLGILLTLAVAGPAGSQALPRAVALVLEVRGATTPALQPYREIRDGARVTLAANGRLVFLHYEKPCPTYTVDGGSVAFSVGEPPVIRAGVWGQRQGGGCPKQLPARSDTAAVIHRSGLAALPPRPVVVLVGARAVEAASLAIVQGETEIFAAPLDGPRFAWPPGAEPLRAGEGYRMELRQATGRVFATLHFFVPERAPAGAETPITLVTVD